MLCVIIGRGRHSSLAEEWKAAAEAGAELVEIRADCLRREPEMKRILKDRPTPLVFTVRRGADGGLWRGPEEKRQALLREAIALGVDYVDLEMDIASSIRRFGKTKRIVSYHNFKGTPPELPDIAEQCDEMDADIVKIATRASTIAEASHVLQIHEHTAVPTIPVAMGDIGTFTRVLGAKFGAPFTYAGFNPERTFAPGMLTFHELKRDYIYDEINAETEVFAVIGDPIGHSLSPAIHNAVFRQLGLNKVMVPLLIPTDTLEASLKELEWLNLKGMSVTIPHKEAIIPLLDEKDAAIELTGACNTVVFKDGKKIGYNTDYRAALESLEEAMGENPDNPADSPLFEKQVLILGAGGAARSIAFGVARKGAHVQITNRHDERATELAEQVGCRTVSWASRASTLAEVIINCTPVGMHPDVDDTPVPPAGLKEGMVVFDTVYHPENTMLLKLARERGAKTVTGVEMFVRQAMDQFKLYTGTDAPKDLMRDVLKVKLGPLRL
jgi:3-dehydroquinate dehydratase/shikimate dehydrogenase